MQHIHGVTGFPCPLSATHSQAPPLTPGAALGRNHSGSSQFLALLTISEYGGVKTRLKFWKLTTLPYSISSLGVFKAPGFPGPAHNPTLSQKPVRNSAYGFHHEAPGW